MAIPVTTAETIAEQAQLFHAGIDPDLRRAQVALCLGGPEHVPGYFENRYDVARLGTR